jgi:hypothetical protein
MFDGVSDGMSEGANDGTSEGGSEPVICCLSMASERRTVDSDPLPRWVSVTGRTITRTTNTKAQGIRKRLRLLQRGMFLLVLVYLGNNGIGMVLFVANKPKKVCIGESSPYMQLRGDHEREVEYQKRVTIEGAVLRNLCQLR